MTDEEGTYLCAAWALVFEGSILAYNPARDKVEWVPAHGIANDLSWVVTHIARLGACHFMSWPNDSSLEEEDDGQVEEEDDEQEDDEPEGDEHEEAEGQGEVGPKSPSNGTVLEQGKTEQEVEPRGQRRSWEWGSIMDEEEPLTFDDLWLDSDATVGGRTPVRSTLQEPGSP